MLYINLMVTTNQKSVIDTQKKRKESKYNTKDSHQKKKGIKNYKHNQKTINKMAVTTLNVTLSANGLNGPSQKT